MMTLYISYIFLNFLDHQIKKGQIVLKKLEKVIKTTKYKQQLLSLSNEFYSTIPHVNIKPKANELGVKILDMEEFRKMIG